MSLAINRPAWQLKGRFRALLRGDSCDVAAWLDERNVPWWFSCVAVIVLGCGLYGGALGSWHGERQAAYAAVKFPLLVLLTTAGNAILNGMLAQLLGTGLSFRQTTLAILLSFTIMAMIVAAFSPLLLFQVANTPPISDGRAGHAPLQVMNFAIIAFAGVMANIRLLQVVEQFSGTRMAARRTLVAWLAGNLLLGSQVAWILRPFVGTPGLPIEFLRAEPLRGSFFESLVGSVLRLVVW